MTRRFLALMLCLVLAFAGCASYTAKPVPTGRLDAMPGFRIEGPLALGIDPYFEVERQKAVFDEKFGKEGVLAIQVTAENRGTGHLVIRHGDMTLEFPDGQQLTPADASAAAEKFAGDATSDIGPAIAFGLVGIFAAMHARQKANSERVADYQAKQFGDATLEKDESRQGFVYFIGESKKTSFSDSALVVRFLDATDGKTYVARLPLRGGAPSQVLAQTGEVTSGPTTPTGSTTSGVEPQLQRLQDLKARGVITADEHAVLRKRAMETAVATPQRPAGSLTARPPSRPSVPPGGLSWPPVGSSYVMSERKSGSYGSVTRQQTIRYLGEEMWQGKNVRAFSDGSITTYVDARRRILVRVKNGTVIEAYDPYFVFADWPIRVGKWWPNRYRYSDYTWNRSFDNVQYDGQVEALEDVRTPAGTFKAFRITLGGGSSKTVLWYSSDLGLVIKMRSERFSNHYLGAGVHETELVSYDFKQ